MKKALLVFLLLFLLGFNKTFAQSISSSSSVLSQVSYELPYPGILPNNPLYFLKAVRDNVLGFFITDPLKKSEYNLLQADKRLGSAKALLDLGQVDLSITTLSKSGNYFDQAISKAEQAKSQGENTNDIFNKLILSSQKQQLVIEEMIGKTKGDNKTSFKLLEERARDFEQRAKIIK
jgi:hypothetical protein